MAFCEDNSTFMGDEPSWRVLPDQTADNSHLFERSDFSSHNSSFATFGHTKWLEKSTSDEKFYWDNYETTKELIPMPAFFDDPDITYRSYEHQNFSEDPRSIAFRNSPRSYKIVRKGFCCKFFRWEWWHMLLIISTAFSYITYQTYRNDCMPTCGNAKSIMPVRNELKEIEEYVQKSQAALYESFTQFIEKQFLRMKVDPVGAPDYALAYSGAKIVDHSPTHMHGAKHRGPFGIRMFYEIRQPDIVIEKPSEAVMPSNCWPFVGSSGYITIELSQPITASAISYEHAPKALLPPNELRSAPKTIELWAGLQLNAESFIGQFSYEIPSYGASIQTLEKPVPAKYVKFNVLDNYGEEDFTCIYRIRVYGYPL